MLSISGDLQITATLHYSYNLSKQVSVVITIIVTLLTSFSGRWAVEGLGASEDYYFMFRYIPILPITVPYLNKVHTLWRQFSVGAQISRVLSKYKDTRPI